MKVYLCGPIHGRTDEEIHNWRDYVTKYAKCETLDPTVRDYRGLEEGNYEDIVDLDKRDIRKSDMMLVYYDRPSVGTSMEIFFAHSLDIEVVLINSSHTKLSPWLLYHTDLVVDTVGEGVQHINECIEWCLKEILNH